MSTTNEIFSSESSITSAVGYTSFSVKGPQETFADVTVLGEETTPTPSRLTAMDITLAIMSFYGFITNFITFLAYWKKGQSFSNTVRILLMHQSILDFSTNALAIIIQLQPKYWLSGNPDFDFVICYFWHSQFLFWVFVYASGNNLVYIALERHLEVLYPIKYKTWPRRYTWFGIAVVHIYTLCWRWPCFFFVHMEGDKCLARWAFTGKLGEYTAKAYGVTEYIVHLLIPGGFLVFFYGKLIYKIKIKRESAESTSATMEKASSQLTKAAMTVSGCFLFTFGWILTYYTPAMLGAYPFIINSPWQRINVLMGAINSCSNPVIYWVFMPAFRKAVKKIFISGRANKVSPSDISSKATGSKPAESTLTTAVKPAASASD